MDQIEFLELYRQEKPIFQAWGEYLIKDINAELQSSGIDINAFLKIPEEAARARAIKPGPFYWLIGEQAAGCCYARA